MWWLAGFLLWSGCAICAGGAMAKPGVGIGTTLALNLAMFAAWCLATGYRLTKGLMHHLTNKEGQ